jgi:hypothetical protein
MIVPEPETGGFGGIVVQHCDLTAFLQEVAQSRILGAAVTWVYGGHGVVLSSPPRRTSRGKIPNRIWPGKQDRWVPLFGSPRAASLPATRRC